MKIDGISEYVKSEDLEDAFSKFGEIQDTYIPRDYRTGRNKMFGFVRYQHENEAKQAVEEADGVVELDGKKVDVSMATRGKREGGGPPRGRDDYGKGRGRSRGRRDSRARGGGGGRRDSRGGGRGGGGGRKDSRDRGGRGGRY